MDDGDRTARQYDAMAASYAADNAESAYNAYYERPATIALLGDVDGRRGLERLVEPQPRPELEQRDPATCEAMRTTPSFLFFRLRPAAGATN